jgi:hypothetical protein
MCRAIHRLHNYEPPATEQEIREASLQYVRKVSGMTRPGAVNREAFERAVDTVARATEELLEGLVTTAPPRDREIDAERARARSAARRSSLAAGA